MTPKILAAAAVLLASTAAPGASQAVPTPCGIAVTAERTLRGVQKYFVEPQYAQMRNTAVQQLAPTAVRNIVTDTVACQSALDTVLSLLEQSDPHWPATAARGYTPTVMRFGPYTLVRIDPDPDPNGMTPGEFVPLFVLRTSDLAYLRVWMI